jgi:hypothetical protein
MAGLFPLPFVGMVSGAILAMTARLSGFRAALFECLAALVMLALLALFVGSGVGPVLGVAALSWVAIAALGSIVRVTRSLTLAIQVAVMAALLLLVGMEVVWGDSAAFWMPVLEGFYADLAQQGVDVQVDIAAQAEITSAALIAGSLIAALFSLLIGMAWAGEVDGKLNGQSFTDLRLGNAISVLAALVGLMLFIDWPTAGAMLILGTAFMFQGVAVLIWWSRRLGWPGGWGLGLMVVMFLVPQLFLLVTMLLATVGFIDNWYGLRRSA